MPKQDIFNADLNKFNAAFKKMGALIEDDGVIVGVDPTVAPAVMLNSYKNLVSYGYANSLL